MNTLKSFFSRIGIYFSLLSILIVMGGIYSGFLVYKYVHEEELLSLEVRAKTIASLVSSESVSSLSISEKDLDSSVYQNLKDRLIEIRNFYEDTRFIYLIAEKNGQIYFLVDSEDPSSEDYSPPGQEYPEASEGVKNSLQKGEVVVEGPVLDRWGSWISALAPIKNSSGQVLGIVGIDIDATAHTAKLYQGMALIFLATLLFLVIIFSAYRIRKKEEEVVNLKSEFIALASHEIRSPLTLIRWKISALLEIPDLSNSLKLSLLQIKEAVLRLITMSNSILETTATDHKIMDKKNFKSVDISLALSNAIIAVEERRLEKSINIIKDESFMRPILVLADIEKLELALINLLSNAIKYSPEKSQIEISNYQEKGRQIISIRDHGMGIPKKEVAHIFGGFYRAQNAKNSGVRGSGFGLYMTKKIIEFFGGVIKCKSEEGKGTTFIIELKN